MSPHPRPFRILPRTLLLFAALMALAACSMEPYRPADYSRTGNYGRYTDKPAAPLSRSTASRSELRRGVYREREERQQIVAAALDMIGVPYRYGGTSPRRGFDCSGLVQYAHRQAGFDVPRTTGQQYQAVIPVRRAALQPGDLVFFKIRGPRLVSHVGIYLGNGKFIHAPSTGKRVSIASLKDHYWRQHYTGAGRMF